MVSTRSSLMKKRSRMHVEQAKEVDAIVDSNVHGSDSINVLHATYEKEKDQNPWPINENIPEPINA